MEQSGWDNPMGPAGFEFIEYAAPDPQAMSAILRSSSSSDDLSRQASRSGVW